MAKAPDYPERPRKSKQAVIVIHGIGEQVPMETLRGFVDTVWSHDPDLIDPSVPDGNTGGERTQHPVWTRPDERNRSFELRRITTESDRNGKRTDFFEFYWAHLTYGSTWEQVKTWLSGLLFRRLKNVPPDVRPAWFFMWAVFLLLLAILLEPVRAAIWGEVDGIPLLSDLVRWMVNNPVFGGALAALPLGALVAWLRTTMVNYAGDVVRYIKATPPNVAHRQEIREQGVELLETLMGVTPETIAANRLRQARGEPLQWDSDYDRIILVGHSLGTIIAYDILKYSFARLHRWVDGVPDGGERPQQPHRHKLERYLQRCLGVARDGEMRDFSVDIYRRHQRACLRELNAQGNPWIVSDFITLGSPLTHAEFLLGKDAVDIRKQQRIRELPVSPPILEWDSETSSDKHRSYHFSYNIKPDVSDETHFRYPHHAAHFAYTRWTNIYSKSRGIFWGDLISGPLATTFCLKFRDNYLSGIRDIRVLPRYDEHGQPVSDTPLFTHTSYWKRDVGEPVRKGEPPYHIVELRKAIDLLDRSDRKLPPD